MVRHHWTVIVPSSKACQLGTAQESRDRGAGSSGAQPLSLSLSLSFLSLSPLSSSLLRAEKKPTRARGDVLLVIIGPGVGESVRERVIWASAERRGEKGGRGGERRAGQSREPGERRAERVEKAARAGAQSGGPRRSGRGGEVCVRRAASPGCSGGRFPSALSAEGSAPQQDLL